ncbi:hypothetical protein ACWOFR_00520 [Carnobacterium gallinarum]|uniref:hypothetical protein n=1 Tax=Carnobacterium gallinarum TaxID=2749 RepID=UPI000691E6D3|nr:hypothetical protein [Carnobacterium gallinarum]
MKKKIVFLVFSALLLATFIVPNEADAKILPYKEFYNQNIYTGVRSGYYYMNKDFPDNQFVRSTVRTIVGPNDWNFNRWLLYFNIY